MAKRSRKYTTEFKRQAVELARELDSATEAAKQLGIGPGNITNWKTRGLGKGAESGSDRRTAEGSTLEQDNRRLAKENAELKKVNYILKTAAAFFSQDHLK